MPAAVKSLQVILAHLVTFAQRTQHGDSLLFFTKLFVQGLFMIASLKTAKDLQCQWRRQMLSHCNSRWRDFRRGFAAMTYLDNANTSSPYIDINNLLVLLLYEDISHRRDRAPLRFVGYRVTRLDDGVRWGGHENCRLFKDLTLSPTRHARGRRMDLEEIDLLSIALRLHRRVGRAGRHAAAPWQPLRLPRLWAGFRDRHVNALQGKGPEFEAVAHQNGTAASELFLAAARRIDGLLCLPMDWVNTELDSAIAVFAEVTPAMRRQVCRVGDLPGGLAGFQSACIFDFYSSRFRRRSRQLLHRRRNHWRQCRQMRKRELG
jgi:hypothetical protein